MSRPGLSIWRDRMWTWLPALVFFLLNLGLLSTYRLVYLGQELALEDRLERRATDLSQAEARHAGRQRLLDRAKANRELVAEFYSQRLGQESERLTRAIGEVKALARRVGLNPTQINYPEELLQDYGLVRRSIAFTVEGGYPQLRQLINLLELSDTFLILEEVGLTDTGGSNARLRITLRVSTLFAQQPVVAPVAPAPRGGP